MMRALLSAAMTLFLAGCTAQVALVSPTGSVSHLIARKSDHSLSGIVDGTPFSGTIITNESMAFGVGQSFGGGTTSTGFSQAYMGGNSGRATMFGPGGENIQCQFNYQLSLIHI